MYGISNALPLFRNSWMKEDTQVGVWVLKRQKQTVLERSYQPSCSMSTDYRNLRTQLLVIDALFSNCLGANEPCARRACQDSQNGAQQAHAYSPNRVPVLETLPHVSESISNGTT